MSEVSDTANSILGNLETILRHIAPGYVVIICVRILYPDCSISATTKEIYFVIAPLLGFILYFMHSNVVYRFLIFPITILFVVWKSKRLKLSWAPLEWNSEPINCKCKCRARILEQEHLLDTHRWKRRGSKNTIIKSVQNELDKWYAMINFIFCSSYALFFVPICFRIIKKIPLCPNQWLSILIGVILFLLVWRADMRATNKQFWACKTYPYIVF